MAKTQTVTARVAAALERVQYEGKRRTNSTVLFEIRKWQETKALAEKELKEAWKVAVAEGIIEPDDKLRALGLGTHVAAESGPFSVTAKVDPARRTLKPDALAEAMARKFKIKLADAIKFIELAKVDGSPVLEKRVLEVE